MPTESLLTPVEHAFILHWGQMGERWGVNRTVAQVHALLYLRPEPMDADTIAETLSVARSNISTSLKELRDWDLVKPVTVLGRRKEHFATDSDPWVLFMTVMDQRKKREIDPTLKLLKELAEQSAKDKKESATARQRIVAMSEMIQVMDAWYASARTLPRNALEAFLRTGSGLAGMVMSLKKK